MTADGVRVPVPTQAGTRRRDFAFVDGLRGLSALAIAVMHAFLFTGRTDEAQRAFPLLGDVVNRGALAVPVFIVLSGFVLMPDVERHGLRVRGGFLDHVKRRSRRILPPYYAALALFTVLIVAVPFLRSAHDTQWEGKVPLDAGSVLSHVFMVHNLNPDWAVKIDGPMWSVATEYQIYFLMPLLLLAWRRVGPWATVVLALLAGVGVTVVLPVVVAAKLWLLGLFAMGMVASWLVQRGLTGRQVRPWAIAVSVVALLAVVPNRLFDQQALTQPVVGAAVALWLVVLAASDRGRVRAVLASRPLRYLGLFSYSLYLFHSPLLAFANLALLDAPLSIGARLAVMWLVALPLAVLLSWVAFWLVERHFLTGHQQRAIEQEATGPAPVSTPTSAAPAGVEAPTTG